MIEKTLNNKSLLITRNFGVDKGFFALLESHGAEVIHFPTIKITGLEDYSNFDTQMKQFEKYDYLVFSSTNAVKYFASRIQETAVQIDFDKIKIIAVGSATAKECVSNGIPVSIVPKEFSAKGIFNQLKETDLTGKMFFIPSSVIARTELKELLLQAGASVCQVPVYNNIIPGDEEIREPRKLVERKTPDLFIFTSPSTFTNFIKIMKLKDVKEYFSKSEIAAIGSVTAAAISQAGLQINIVPDEFTMNSLVEKIVQYYIKKDNPS